MTDAKLKGFIDRVLRSREREDAEKENTKQIYKELAGEGYDKTVVGKVVNYLRKDQDKAREQSQQFDLYLAAYLGASHVHARVREDDEEFDPETGEISSTAARKDVLGNEGKDEASSARDVLKSHSSPAGTQAPPVETNPGNGAGGAETEASVATVGATASANSSQAGPSVPVRQPSSAGTEGEEDRQPIPEPVGDPPADPLRSEAATRKDADTPAQGPAIVLQLRTYNPDTHFLSKDGLQRLHGCLNPEACASIQPRVKLCFSCSVKHDGPSPSGEVA